MELTRLLHHPLALTEAAVIEAIAHSTPSLLHPDLFNAVMVEHPEGRQILKALYTSFYQVAKSFDLPFVITTPTWRASRERIKQGISEDINEKAVAFLKTIVADLNGEETISLGGLLGCRHDCYRPDLGLNSKEARRFHAWQADRLAHAGPDFLMGVTLPALEEATGIARAMAATGLPYMISFVINRQGEVLDGTPLAHAVDTIDQKVSTPPLGYMVNCAHPSFLRADHQPKHLFSRLMGFQANGSSLDHDQLDQAPVHRADDITDWADQMIRLNREYGIRILGGCCGTRTDHLACMARGIF